MVPNAAFLPVGGRSSDPPSGILSRTDVWVAQQLSEEHGVETGRRIIAITSDASPRRCAEFFALLTDRDKCSRVSNYDDSTFFHHNHNFACPPIGYELYGAKYSGFECRPNRCMERPVRGNLLDAEQRRDKRR